MTFRPPEPDENREQGMLGGTMTPALLDRVRELRTAYADELRQLGLDVVAVSMHVVYREASDNLSGLASYPIDLDGDQTYALGHLLHDTGIDLGKLAARKYQAESGEASD